MIKNYTSQNIDKLYLLRKNLNKKNLNKYIQLQYYTTYKVLYKSNNKNIYIII